MVSQTVPVRLDNETLSFIDFLVEQGVYSSRSEALRELIKAGVEEAKWIVKIIEGANKLLEIEKKTGETPIKLTGALKQLLKERERL